MFEIATYYLSLFKASSAHKYIKALQSTAVKETLWAQGLVQCFSIIWSLYSIS